MWDQKVISDTYVMSQSLRFSYNVVTAMAGNRVVCFSPTEF
jgi:hypothetical protein